MVEIIDSVIDEEAILKRVRSELCGAVVLFSGTTRRETNGRVTETLHYQAYGEMALSELQKIRQQAVERFDLQACAIVHRVGEVPLGETSIVVAVSSAHRKQAFAAASWIMDTVKSDVPIWKQEVWADGKKEWVHPGASPGGQEQPQ